MKDQLNWTPIHLPFFLLYFISEVIITKIQNLKKKILPFWAGIQVWPTANIEEQSIKEITASLPNQAIC